MKHYNPSATGSGGAPQKKPNILFIMSDDIGWFNISCNNNGIMGYRTPNIDRIAKEGANFTDFYGQQSCTAGRAAFITGQSPIRTGLTKVGMPGATLGLNAEDPSVGDVMNISGMLPDNSARTIWAIAMNTCPPFMASMNSLAICITLMRKKNPSIRTGRRIRSLRKGLALAGC